MSMNVKFFTQTDNDLLFGEMIEEAPIPQFNYTISSRIVNAPDPIEQCVKEMEDIFFFLWDEDFIIQEFVCWVDDQKALGRKIFVDMF